MTALLTAVQIAANLTAVLVRAVADGLEKFAESIGDQQVRTPDVLPEWVWSE